MTSTVEDRSQALWQSLTPEEYPDAGGFTRARELLAAGVRLTDSDWYNLVISEAWAAIRLHADHHVLPSAEQMSSCLAYALVHLNQKLPGVQALLHAIDQSTDPTYAHQLTALVQKQEHAECVRQLASATNADDRQAGQLLADWLDAQTDAD